MEDFAQAMATLKRPRTLATAAKALLARCNADVELGRIIGGGIDDLCANDAARTLLEREAQAEAQRREGLATYSVRAHVEVLAALLFEFRKLTSTAPRGA